MLLEGLTTNADNGYMEVSEKGLQFLVTNTGVYHFYS